MKISIITVPWNSKEKIGQQIESVRKAATGLEFEEIAIDNASSDGTADFIRQNFLQVKLVANDKNVGFAAANNQGLKIAQGEYILFLNPDMKCEENSLGKLIDYMEKNRETGIVSCKLDNERGEFNPNAGPRRFPTVLNQLAIILKLPHFFPSLLDNYLMKDFDPEKEQEVDSVRGSFMLIRRSVLQKLGWAFDPRYFIWFEDVDLCHEVKKMGLKVMYVPFVSCVDYVGQSFKQRDSFWKQKNFTLSVLKYFQKWEPWYKWIWVYKARAIVLAGMWVKEKIF
ncbi:MAG: hypothetical protein A2294_01890 [Candidatus Magasanikbacteria bacterium RIFOXYB2_FULL_38_10]|nr:MAG: hypothetical protein A2294_01890 [Candidatus Magasanikbacteria bacterium RIFOXYB2_FULL_38_10]